MLSDIPWICPVCRKKLIVVGSSLICEERHCYDIAKSGYVNLLISSSQGNHGDDKLMVRSRSEFLEKGYYSPLADEVTRIVSAVTDKDGLIADAGCGEGYYTERIAAAVSAGVAGIDISREAVLKASKRRGKASYAVASTADIPLEDSSADTAVNIFAPLFAEEFSRILKPGGKLIRVLPGERHLWELKELIYDRPYENPPPEPEVPCFRTEFNKRLEYKITLPDTDSIRQLFMMTPYYYKTGEKDQQKLFAVEQLTTTVQFEICVSAAVKQ